MATNVSFGDYTPLEPPRGQIDIRIGVFLDGTMNNRTNTDSRLGTKGDKGNKAYKKYSGNDSYENDWSNIARLETAYTENEEKYISKIYIEGIGTENFDRDSSYFTKGAGGAFGSGSTGIIAKVIKGCEQVAEKIQKIKKKEKVNCIYLDVFGFSRGAAAARNFVYEVTKNKYPARKMWVDTDGDGATDEIQTVDDHNTRTSLKELPRYGHLGLKLTEAGMDVTKIKVKVEFVGLFDTVSSYDPSTTGAFKNFENDVMELNLNAISQAKKIFHLIAADEHRVNFMLTKVTAAKGDEYILPGVHSDVGGSYVHDAPDNVQLLDFDNIIGDGYRDKEWNEVMNNDLNNLISQGWFIEKEVKRPNTWHETYGNRPHISNRYSFIPLHIMAENILKFQNGIVNLIRLAEKKYVIPNGKGDKKYSLDLVAVKKRLDQYIEGKKPKMWYCTNKELEYYRKQMQEKKMTIEKFNLLVDDHNMLLALRRKYFHWSAKYGEVGLQSNFDFKDKFNIRRFRKTDKYS